MSCQSPKLVVDRFCLSLAEWFGMQITDREIDGVLVIGIEGRLTAGSDGLFKSEMTGRMTKSDKIVFDCSALEYIDSTGLGLIVRFYKDFTNGGGKFALAALQSKPKLVFEITRASKIFDLFDAVESAVEFLKK